MKINNSNYITKITCTLHADTRINIEYVLIKQLIHLYCIWVTIAMKKDSLCIDMHAWGYVFFTVYFCIGKIKQS